jgi:hypothetical protein
MEHFKRYLDQIKAEEELKEKTKIYLRKTLSETKKDEVVTYHRTYSHMKKVLAFACTFVLVFSLAAAGYAYYMAPVNYVSLDINPSVEIALNALDRVVSVKATNADGEILIYGEHMFNSSLENAVNRLVQKAADRGYVNQDGSSVIAVTVESDNEEKAKQLQEKGSNGVDLAMSNKNTFAAVYSDCSDLALRDEAKALDISPGKYKMIMMLQTLDPNITVAQYKDAKVHEIISKADEILQDDAALENKNEETKEISAIVKDTIKEVKENQGKAAEKEKGGNQQNQDNTPNGNSDNAHQNENTTVNPDPSKGRSDKDDTEVDSDDSDKTEDENDQNETDHAD